MKPFYLLIRMAPSSRYIETFISIFSKDKDIIVSCRSGKRNEKSKTFLMHHGFINVHDEKGWVKLNKYLRTDK